MSVRRSFTVASVLVLAAGALVGWRAGEASAGHTDTTVTTSPATVSTQQRVVVVTTPTTPAVDLPGYGKPPIHLGDMNTPEQFIIGALYQLALQQRGYTVIPNPNIGPPAVRAAAMQQGALDMYPDYLDQWNSQVAQLHSRYDTLRASYTAGSAYAQAHGYELLRPTRASDTSAIAVTASYAALNHVNSISDLARGPRIIIGVPLDLRTGSTGLFALSRAYGLDHPYPKTTLIGLEYQALSSGNAQAAYVNSTDPQLLGSQYKLLRDPKHFFGFGNIVPVTTPAVLAQEGPAFRQTINRVDSVLTTRALRGLNTEYLVDHHKPAVIAQQFLQGNGILPPTIFKPVGAPG
jgi:glycine betaine/choline ABC-type transport system substrate-binding protein